MSRHFPALVATSCGMIARLEYKVEFGTSKCCYHEGKRDQNSPNSGTFRRGVAERWVFALACLGIVTMILPPRGWTGNRTVTQKRTVLDPPPSPPIM